MAVSERGPLDALDAHEEIGAWAPPAGYDGTQRYRDFRAVFIDGGATPEQARRVLNILLAKCGLLKDPVIVQEVGGDDKVVGARQTEVHLTFLRLGEQNIGRWLLAHITHMPRSEPLPEHAISEDPEE